MGPGSVLSVEAASSTDALATDQGIEILRGLRDPKAPPPEVSGRRLADLGPGVVGLLMDVLEGRRVPDVEGGTGDPQVLSRAQRETILVALESLGRGIVMPAFEQRLASAKSYDERRAAVEVIGAVAEGGEFERLFSLTLDPETARYDAKLSKSLQQSVAGIVSRDAYGFEVLEHQLGDLDEGQLEAVILGVGRTRDPAGLEVLTSVPWGKERHRILIASQVPLLAPSNTRDLNREVADQMFVDLGSPNDNLVNASILALSGLEDFSCVPRLIELLGSESTRIRSSAHHALCRITGKSTTASLGVWRHWYRTEDQWARTQGDRSVDALLGGNEKEALAALEDIGTHRLGRHRLALETSVALFHDSARVRSTACNTLAGLGSRWSVNGLRDALLDPSIGVTEAAHAALLTITGEHRDAEYASWEDYAAPDPRGF